MPAERLTDESKAFFHAMMPANPLIQVRPMFGSLAAFIGGNMFAGLKGNRIFVRLSDAAREELLAEEGATLFEPAPGRPMKEYVTLPEAWHQDLDRMSGWVSRAAAWVTQMPEKPVKPKAKNSSQ